MKLLVVHEPLDLQHIIQLISEGFNGPNIDVIMLNNVLTRRLRQRKVR